MKFLSTRTLVLSVCTGLLVWLLSRTGREELIDNRFQNDQQQTNAGDETTFSSCLIFGRYCSKPDKRYSYRGMKLQIRTRKLRRVQKLFVDKSGFGDFNTVQEAVDAVMDDNTERVIIHIKAGTYKEKVHVPINKPYLTFEGAGLHESVIAWDDDESKSGSTLTTATVTVEADYFIGRNISFKNTAPIPDPSVENGGQAIALRVSGDAAAFYGCGMYGYQDTLNDDQGRHLFRECHIEGAVDFIFGNGRSLYERCTIKSIAIKTGCMTAQARQSKNDVTGFGFVHCNIIGTGLIVLGRAWRPYARVVIASTYMDNIIDRARWNDWGNKNADETIYFGEYENSGPGANMSGHVAYFRHLSSDDAAYFTRIKWIDGSEWLEE